MFQFQDGTIIRNYSCRRLNRCRVSIPRWYDYKKITEMTDKVYEFVSIPRWYDYKAKLSVIICILSMFQFQDGTIISEMNCATVEPMLMFQFQDGTIISLLKANIIT